MTPEGKVKEQVKEILDRYKPSVYYEMNVPTGYGKSGLDFIGALRGHAFSIETKAYANQTYRSRQEGTRDDMLAAGMAVFLIAGLDATSTFEAWADEIIRRQ